jgi:hypothetical protein
MAIVSSTHTLGTIQKDGRRFVIEDHLDNIGKHWLIEYLAAIGEDYVARRTARAVVLAQQLVDTEIAAALAVDADPVLIYATKVQFVPVLREAYRSSIQSECARLATWVLNRIDSGYVTETQVQNAFGLTAGQWTTLKAKMVALRTDYQAIQAAAGE